MTEFLSPELEKQNVSMAPQGMRHYVLEQTIRGRNVPVRTMGAREQEALVAAVKQNFPEVYDMAAKKSGAVE